jgi:hypothetical protein
MTTKLTLSIDEEKVKKIKRISKEKGVSVSKIFEAHIDELVARSPKKQLDAKELIGLFGKAPKNFNADKVRWGHLKKKHGL